MSRRRVKTLPTPKNIDKVITSIVRLGLAGPRKSIALDTKDVQEIVMKAREIFLSQPMLLELDAPVLVVGDIHGDLNNLVQVLEQGGHPRLNSYLFLGDYVDRGKYGLEVIILLFCFKIKRPENFFLLRGNHESLAISKRYGFQNECMQKQSAKIYKLFVATFNCMPIAALIANQIFCCHGGISFNMETLQDINKIPRPIDIPDKGLMCDLLWSDPTHQISGWGGSGRGAGYTFGKTALREWMKKHGVTLVARAHQVVQEGYLFFDNKNLVTLFSAPNYTNRFDNKAAVMKVDGDLTLSIKTIKPPKAQAKLIWTRLK